MYQYKATITEVYDGDTCTAIVDLGFTVSVKVKFRLLGINTPELKGGTTTSKAKGIQARDRLRELVLGKEVFIDSYRGSDAFGRWLCILKLPETGEDVNKMLLDEGLAIAFT